MRSTPSLGCGLLNRARAFCRASALSFGAIPSSNSTQTISTPLERALGNISGLSPGTKMKLRRGCMEVFLIIGLSYFFSIISGGLKAVIS